MSRTQKQSAVGVLAGFCTIQSLTSTALLQYEPDSAPALALNATIDRTETRFATYARQGLLCGADGLPHLISDPGLAIRYGHAGETLVCALTTFCGVLCLKAVAWGRKLYTVHATMCVCSCSHALHHAVISGACAVVPFDGCLP